MAGFKLTQGADTYDFDVFGPVKDKNGTAVGTWGTDKNNKIVVKRNAGAPLSFDVEWKFNANNQLCLNSGGQEVFNFHAVGNRPYYYTQDAVLKVRPDQNRAFGFELRGEWDITDKHDLSFTVGGVTSIIDGYVQDERSRFMYHFFDKKDITQRSVLGFVGQWSHMLDADGTPKLDFNYQREDGTVDTFGLPKGVVIDTTVNQFIYEYDKKGHKYRIQFAGFLKVSEDFTITYDIDRQVSQSGAEQVAATSFTIKAQISKKAFAGNIEFAVKKMDGTVGASTLALRGNFTAVRGQTRLQVGFSFEQVRGASVVTTKFGFNGTLEWRGGKVQWTFERNATKTTIAIAATDIKLGPARIDAVLNLINEHGQMAGVYFLLGVSF